jgi:Ni,Fe-hydrogenase maturation factor
LRKVLARLSTTGRTEDVQSLTALVLASQPDHAAARFAQGINYYFQRRFTEAIPLLEAALRTLGSCFARHMARALKEAGHECYHIEVGDVINTTYADRAIMEWIAGTLDPALEQRMNEVVGALTTKENFVEQIRRADVFIFTLGVAACFFERDTGRFVMPRPTSINSRALAETYDFRTTRVSENVANMKFIIDAMRAINPELKIFITVSPAPLHVTFERNASVVGDCLSKSVMRVSADELMHSGYKDIHYWPSFEIVRWLSGHVGPFFGVDDGASWHISEKLIEQIIGLFLERFTPQQQIAA